MNHREAPFFEEDDYDNLDIKKEVQEIVEVKDPLDIKLEPVVQDLPILDDDEDLDDLDDKTEKSEKSLEEDSDDISDNDNDKDFEPSEKSEKSEESDDEPDEDIEVDIEHDSEDESYSARGLKV